jgi:exonuclease III
MNKRGVGILINKKISYTVAEQYSDPEENILLIKATIRGELLVLGSIYGPNTTDENFFNNLKRAIGRLSNNGEVPVVVGGDWNCTYCQDPPEVNIDVLNMRELPNRRHSELIQELCTEFNMVDPFRVLYFNRREFTYVPRSLALTNKSRLDFFLVTENVFNNISDCEISEILQNKLFDHKAIRVVFNSKNTNKLQATDSVFQIKHWHRISLIL